MTGSSKVLGLSCFYHDAAACLMTGGRVAAAAQEERFTRRKNESGFPARAVAYCLEAGGVAARDLDAVVFYEKPFLKLSRVLAGHLAGFPRTFASFRRTMPHWLHDRLTLPLDLKSELGFDGPVYFVKHHLAHAASAFLPSGFDEAAILTADSVGEWATVTRGRGAGGQVRVESEMIFPDSLGLLYSAVTAFLGFEANEGEGTVMGLAAFGAPSFLPKLREIVSVRADGTFSLDQSYFDFYGDEAMRSPRFASAFGPPRAPGAPLTDRDRDLAASLQALTEDILLRLARDLRARTGSDDLCLAGGVFLNCSANQRLLEDSGFKRLFVQPAAGDAGGALGAAAFVSRSMWGLPPAGAMDPYLGPAFSSARGKSALSAAGLSWKELDEDGLCRAAARTIARGGVLGWVQGRMELGPRALGNRSILADPRDARTKDRINAKVKGREEFRPFAPAVLAERAAEFFHLDAPSPFMLLAPRVREEKKAAIPAVTHADGTARTQTVTAESNARLHRLLKAFDAETGVPVLVNTSFNRRGEPIVCSPEDAVACFRETGLDALVLGDLFVERHGTA